MADEIVPNVEIAPAIPAVENASIPEITTTETVAPEATSEVKEIITEIKPKDTLLGEPEKIEPVVDAKTTDIEPAKETESSQSDEPAPLPTYDEFVSPDDFVLDKNLIGDFTNKLGEFEKTTKADHAEVQKFGQSLIDSHIAEVKNSVERLNKSYIEAFENQKMAWKDAFEKDQDIGGNRKDTTLSAAREFIKTHGGTHEQQEEFRELLNQTGVGNHPAMIRMLAQAARSKAFTEGQPLPATRPVSAAKSRLEKMYGTS